MKKESIGLALIGFFGLTTIVALSLAGRLAQDDAYHNFSDIQTYLALPNALNVISNLPFLVVGVIGLWLLMSSKTSQFNIVQSQLSAYRILYFGVTLVCFGSGYYHLNPNTETLVWDRLPMTIAFMALYSIIISEFISVRLGKILLLPLLAVGIASVLYWRQSELVNMGDLRFYAVVQFFPMITIPIMLLFFKSSYVSVKPYWILMVTYLLAKIFEHFDAQIHDALVVVSGHSIKHVLPAIGLFVLLKAYTNTTNSH